MKKKNEKKYFLSFSLHGDIERQMAEKQIKTISPNKYFYDNSVWIEMEPLEFYCDGLLFFKWKA